MKSILRFSVKTLSLLFGLFSRQRSGDVCVLMYHRVKGDSGLELDLSYDAFERQMHWLYQNANVLHLRNLTESDYINNQDYSSNNKMHNVVLTFDDAFEDFYHVVWPLLKKFGFPAVLYVPTLFIENPDSVPVSADVPNGVELKPISLQMLLELEACPLVTIGAHSHTHREFPTLHDDEIVSEIRASDEFFSSTIGRLPSDFAYPRGACNSRCEVIASKRYSTIATVSGGVLNVNNFSKYRISRVPILRSDGFFWFKLRVKGLLFAEESVVAFFRGLLQSRRSI